MAKPSRQPMITARKLSWSTPVAKPYPPFPEPHTSMKAVLNRNTKPYKNPFQVAANAVMGSVKRNRNGLVRDTLRPAPSDFFSVAWTETKRSDPVSLRNLAALRSRSTLCRVSGTKK